MDSYSKSNFRHLRRHFWLLERSSVGITRALKCTIFVEVVAQPCGHKGKQISAASLPCMITIPCDHGMDSYSKHSFRHLRRHFWLPVRSSVGIANAHCMP